MAAAVEAGDKRKLLQLVGLVHNMLAGQESAAGDQLWRFEAAAGDVAFQLLDQGPASGRRQGFTGPWTPDIFSEGVAPEKKIKKPKKTSLGSAMHPGCTAGLHPPPPHTGARSSNRLTAQALQGYPTYAHAYYPAYIHIAISNTDDMADGTGRYGQWKEISRCRSISWTPD
eukprot:363614-Chlamydomonas_euryale.AAC.6